MGLKENLIEVESRIVQACESAGRSRDSVTLVAVTKTVPAEVLRQAYDLGLRVFGENRLQEAIPKLESLPSDIEWHFIGHLQSNKAKRVAQLFEVIQTVCSEAQLKEIVKAERPIDVLIEVNVGEEPQKSGILPVNLAGFVERVLQYEHIRLKGLMTVGPNLDDSEAMRPYFRRMREWNAEIGGSWLSMGMSSDLDVAIQEGATHVRVGTALFGSRRNN